MSKIRQAVEYERQIAREEVRAHRELVAAQIDYERKLSDALVNGQVEIRDEALAYERKITDSQFETLRLLAEEHRQFHEREHLLYESAIEKASSALAGQLVILSRDIETMELASHGYMTIDRFEREHGVLTDKVETAITTLTDKLALSHDALSDKLDQAIATLNEKLVGEHDVTIRQDTSQLLLDKIAESSAVNRRWLAGLAASLGVTLFITVLNWLRII